MSTVIDVRRDDEIADVVGRVRATEGTGDVALVVPGDVRLLQTTVNLRLLKQFVQSTGRRTAIVSGDARTQQLATSAGFPVYASAQAYARGIELMRQPTHGAGAGFSAAGAFEGGTATAVKPPPVAAPPPAFATGTMVPRGQAAPPPDHRRYYVLGVAAGVLGLLLLALVVPTATVTLTLAADPINVSPTLQGSADQAVAGRPDMMVTTVVSDDQSAQFQVTPTGSQTIQAAKATGTVTIVNQAPFAAAFTSHRGDEFDTADNPPVRFFVTQDINVCASGIGPGASCLPANTDGDVIPVVDGTAEGRGNVQPGAIKVWPQNPCGQANPKCAPTDLRVTNPQATSGGADAKTLVIATAQDVQTMTTHVRQAQSQLTNQVQQNMAAKADRRVPAIDPGGAGRTLTCSVDPPLPKVNDPYRQTNVTVACHGKETTYFPDDAVRVVTRDLQARVPGGDQLAPNCHIPAPLVTQAADDGTAILSASGDCFAQPVVDIDGLRGQFAGKSAGAVAQLTRTHVGPQVTGVVVEGKPFSLPWLPLFSSRIDVHETVVAKKGAGQ